MGLDDLQATIKKLKDKIETHRPYLFGNEAAARQVLVDPLLLALGWDVSDPNQVKLEYPIKKKKADYVLMSNDEPDAVIEAKSLGTQLDDETIIQAINYANMAGIQYMVITNGDDWVMYDVFSPKPIEERILMEFKITRTPAHKNVLQAVCMWRSNLASEHPMLTRDLVLQPDATEQPFESDDRADSPISSPVAEPDTDPGWTSLTNLSDVDKNSPKPKCIKFPDGCTEQFRASSVGVLRETAKWLITNGKLKSENAQVPHPKYKNRYVASSKEQDLQKPEKICTGVYIEKNWIAQDSVDGAKGLLEHCEEDPSTVQVSFTTQP